MQKSELKSKTSEEISKSTSGLGIPGFKWAALRICKILMR